MALPFPPIRDALLNGKQISKVWLRWFKKIRDTADVNFDNKADKVSGTTDGYLAGLDASGNLTNSGKKPPTGDIVGTSDAQTLTNKTLDADLNTISNLEHGAEVDNPSSGVHGVSGDVVGTTDAQTLTNKTLTDPIISNLTASRPVASDANKKLTSIDLIYWILGTTNQVIVSDNGDGSVTLSLPQNIHSGASPTFAGNTLNGASVLNKSGTADSVTSYPSRDLILRGSGWDGAAEVELDNIIRTIVENGGQTYRLAFLNDVETEIAALFSNGAFTGISSTVGVGGQYAETFTAAGSSSEIAILRCAPKDQIDNFTGVAFSGWVYNDTAAVTTTATLQAYNGTWNNLGTVSVTGAGGALGKSAYTAIPAGTVLFSFIISVDGASAAQLNGPTLYFQ